MNKKLLILGLSFIALASCSSTNNNNNDQYVEEIDNTAEVILLLGQSNAEGHSYSQYLTKTMGEEKAKEYATGYSNVQICYQCTVNLNTSNGEFTDTKLGQGSATNLFGPEIGIAETFNANHPNKKLYIIKYCYGGTTLSTNWRSPSSGITGNLYRAGLTYIQEQCEKLESMDLYPIIRGVCWMQGESDSTSNDYNNYESYERKFISDLRDDTAYYSDPNNPWIFIDATIANISVWTRADVINGAKVNIASDTENDVLIDTNEAGLKTNGEPAGSPDVYHYDSSSMIKLGRLFGEQVLNTLFLN